MKAVGVKQLKAKLSEYLRFVKAGDTVLVTERDEVIAEIRPTHREPIQPTDIEAILDSMAEKGEVTLRAEEPGLLPKIDVKLTGISSGDILDKLREDKA